MGDKNEQERQKNSRERVMRVQFNAVLKDVTRKGTKIQTDEYLTEGKFPIIDQGNNDIAGYRDDETGLFTDVPAIVFGDHTRIVKYITEPFFLGADGVKVLVPIDRTMNCKYLYYQLLSAKIPDTGYNRHFKWVKELEFQLPSRNEQDDVAERLDKLCVVISARQQQLAKLDELVKARFVEMFGGINESVWYPYQTIESFTSVMSGGTPDRNIPEYWQENIRWIKTTELKNCIITDTEEKISQLGVENSSAKIIPANSILVAMYGQGKTRGMTGYITVECATNQACACILPSEKINQKYLWKYIIFSYDKLRSMAKGGNQPNLNAGIIRKFPVLMPPMNLQNRFAVFAEQVEKTKLFIQNSLKQMETLKKALIQQYFG